METDEAKEELEPILWFDDVTPEYRVASNPLEAAIERLVLFGEGSHISTICYETVTTTPPQREGLLSSRSADMRSQEKEMICTLLL